MEKLQYDVEGRVIPLRKCSPCLVQCWILVTVLVGAFAGTLFYQRYYQPHRLVAPGSPEQEIFQEPFDMTYVKYNNDSLLAVSEVNGFKVAVVRNRDSNTTFQKFTQIFRHPDVMLAECGQLLLEGDKIVPDDIRQQMWDSPVGSQFLVKIYCRQGQVELDSIQQIISRDEVDLVEYAYLIEAVMTAAVKGSESNA